MTSYTFTIQPIVRRNKANADGDIPVYFKLIVNKKVVEIATRHYVPASLWSPDKGKMKGNTEKARTINGCLDNLKTKLRKIYLTLEEKGEIITAEKIKNIYIGKDGQRKTLLEVFAAHNQLIKLQIGIDFSHATYVRYCTTLELIKEFIHYQYKVNDMALEELNHAFVTSLELWFKTIRRCNHNTTIKYISNLRKVIYMALNNDWTHKNPFTKFKFSLKEVKREALTQEELTAIAEKEFSTQRLAQVRDVFLFCCYTGLAYADIKTLSPRQISRGMDGKYWIFTERTKTKTTSQIPLLSVALALIEKYKDHPQVVSQGRILPVPANQKMNAYLKEIADLCGITKNLTTHLARHTFATTVTLTNGVPLETVSSMLGHKNIRTTQIYAKVVQSKISTDMQNLEEKLNGNPASKQSNQA